MPTFDGNLNEITFGTTIPADYANTFYTHTATNTPRANYTNINTEASNTYTGSYTYTYDTTTYVTKNDLNEYFKRIYEIINEHVLIDISEEDFVNIIMEG